MRGVTGTLFCTVVPALLIPLCGCAGARDVGMVRETGGNAALFGQFAAFDGRTGQPMSFEQVVERAASADAVLFGEEHSNMVCNAIEAQLLYALAQQPRPVTLAMEFFEADTQAAVDAYFNGRTAEAEFRKLARQGDAYLTSHRPMIEFCRKANVPLLAANAPRRLTRAFRLSGRSYLEFRMSLDPADRAWLPRTSEMIKGPYYDRFVKAMADHEMPAATSQPNGRASSQPTTQPSRAELMLRSYRAHSLWDDSMAESVANYRGCYPDRRVILIVGLFHIASDGGTAVKFHQRRPQDSIFKIVYRGTTHPPFAFAKADRDAGDVVIYGMRAPDDEEPVKPTATSKPTSGPATGRR